MAAPNEQKIGLKRPKKSCSEGMVSELCIRLEGGKKFVLRKLDASSYKLRTTPKPRAHDPKHACVSSNKNLASPVDTLLLTLSPIHFKRFPRLGKLPRTRSGFSLGHFRAWVEGSN